MTATDWILLVIFMLMSGLVIRRNMLEMMRIDRGVTEAFMRAALGQKYAEYSAKIRFRCGSADDAYLRTRWVVARDREAAPCGGWVRQFVLKANHPLPGRWWACTTYTRIPTNRYRWQVRR